MESELSLIRQRTKDDCSKEKETTKDDPNIKVKLNGRRTNQSLSDTLVCSVIILVSLIVIIYRSNIISTHILPGFRVIILIRNNLKYE